MNSIPTERLRRLNDVPVGTGDRYVLYWMVANRRLEWNFALDHAVAHARRLGLPLVVLEALRVGYRWASVRHHAFAIQGMREHRTRLAGTGIAYHAYVEPHDGAGKGLLEALARDAAVVVTDDFPAFFIPRMQDAIAPRLAVALEAVDSNGLLPLQVTPGPFSAAYHFRRFLQKELGEHLVALPSPEPLAGGDLVTAHIPDDVRRRWPEASDDLLAGEAGALAALPIDASVTVSDIPGGSAAGRARLEAFLDDGFLRYGDERSHPDAHAASGLSPYLHWGHLSAHEIFHAVATREGWSPARITPGRNGARHGWWGMSATAESFLDELVTWRELGFVYCRHVPDHHRYEVLPEWARTTLEEHADDPRPWRYDLDALDRGATHDTLWNAAQRELRTRGVMQNYLRMLWGKKILEWTDHPRQALDIMIELNNRYALDGRDPNSYSGIFWVLGRFDRGWPERPIFGKIRYMTSDSTRRKLRLKGYLERWGEPSLFPEPS